MLNIINLNGTQLKRSSAQLGSNKGGFFEDIEKKQFYIKYSDAPNKLINFKNEFLALKLYALFGINVPTADFITFEDNGKNYYGIKIAKVESKTVHEYFAKEHTRKGSIFSSMPLDPNKSSEFSDYKKKAWSGFLVDCLLANWDVVGLEYDNLSVDTHGNPLRLDTGGSLYYRAQGAPKGGAFNKEANEFSSLSGQDANIQNPASEFLFSEIMNDPDALRDALERLNQVSDDELNRCIADNTFPGAENLFTILQARRDSLRNKVQSKLSHLSGKKIQKIEREQAFSLSSSVITKLENSWRSAGIQCNVSATISADKDKANVNLIISDKLIFLCCKKYLDNQSVTYTIKFDSPSNRNIIVLSEMGSEQATQLIQKMTQELTNQQKKQMLMEDVRRDMHAESERKLTEFKAHIEGAVRGDLRIDQNLYKKDDDQHNKAQPIEKVQLQFKSLDAADQFIGALRQFENFTATRLFVRVGETRTRDPVTGKCDIYVECKAELIENKEFFDAVLMNYTMHQKREVGFIPFEEKLEYQKPLYKEDGNFFNLSVDQSRIFNNIIHNELSIKIAGDNSYNATHQSPPYLYRIKHGGLHAARVALHTTQWINVLAHYDYPGVAELTEKDKYLIKVAALFHDAGRGKDFGDDTLEWELAGAQKCRQFLEKQGFSKEDIKKTCDAITGKDDTRVKENNVYALILGASDSLDWVRSHHSNFNSAYLPTEITTHLKLKLSQDSIDSLYNQLATNAARIAAKQSDLARPHFGMTRVYDLETKKQYALSKKGCFTEVHTHYMDILKQHPVQLPQRLEVQMAQQASEEELVQEEQMVSDVLCKKIQVHFDKLENKIGLLPKENYMDVKSYFEQTKKLFIEFDKNPTKTNLKSFQDELIKADESIKAKMDTHRGFGAITVNVRRVLGVLLTLVTAGLAPLIVKTSAGYKATFFHEKVTTDTRKSLDELNQNIINTLSKG